VTWLVDTNVISELRKGARCHPIVATWWTGVEDRDLFLSVLTLGEIRKGVEGVRPRDPAKAMALENWLAEVADAFGARVLGVDAAVAEAWGRIASLRSVSIIDALLAATANVHDLVLVTRNTADVVGLGVRVLNPFEAAPA
jgi:predicted nucleic acid-binding protein